MSIRNGSRILVLVAGVVFAGAGWAQNAQGGNSTVSITTKDANGTPVTRVIFQNLDPQTAAQKVAEINAQIGKLYEGQIITGATSAGLRGFGGTGAAAAGGAPRWNVWGAASYSRVGNSFQPLQTNGNVGVLTAGLDYRLLDNLLVGVAVSSDRSRIGLDYVAGGGSLSGNGYSVSPYLGYAINRSWVVDASLGYGNVKYDVSGGGITGNFRGSSTFGSLGVNYRHEGPGRWLLSGRGAVLAGSSRTGSFTASNGNFVDGTSTNFSQLRLGGQVAYAAGSVVPYFSLSYVYDLQQRREVTVGNQTSATDRDSWVPAFGLRFSSGGAAYGSLQFSSERGRSQIKNDQVLFNLGVRF